MGDALPTATAAIVWECSRADLDRLSAELWNMNDQGSVRRRQTMSIMCVVQFQSHM